MINVIDKQKCCGCEACVQSCPKKCIEMIPDDEGFLYPQVDSTKCIECNLCERVCPILNTNSTREPIASFAAYNNNEYERSKSSSGGLFVLLAKKVIDDGGIVYGAKFDGNWNVVHSCAETYEELKSFTGSKYVQSRICNTFSQARKHLQSGRRVLFSGTPCQIAGLRRYLKKDYDNLITVDFICHGVPSPGIWNRYLNEITHNGCKEETLSKYQIQHNTTIGDKETGEDSLLIEGISFRDKRTGWKKYSITITLAEKNKGGVIETYSLSRMFRDDPYMKSFLFNLSLRPSCYNCPAKEGKSGSDITLADFWGIDKYVPNLDNDKGTSAVMINTEKGDLLFKSITVFSIPIAFETIKANNSAYYKSAYRHPKRDLFFNRNDLTICERAAKFAKLPTKKIVAGRFLIVASCIKSLIKSIIKK